MAKLYFYYSAMNAGKTTLLLQSAHNYRERGMDCLLFTPHVDTRYEQNKITSRIGVQLDAVTFDGDFDFYKYVQKAAKQNEKLKCVLIDEAQFLTKKQVAQLGEITDNLDLPVLSYGLRSDFQGEPFEGSKYLLIWADNLVELKTICHCGRKATMNVRVDEQGRQITKGKQIHIGGNEAYVAMCRKHFGYLNRMNKKIDNYRWVLFDIDETLFDFDAFAGLKRMFAPLGVSFTEADYREYYQLNKSLWIDYQKGVIAPQHLREARFLGWSKKLNLPAHDLNNAFLASMAEISKPLAGALSLLNRLKGRVSLGIVTNGFTELQQARIERAGLQGHFDLLVISEQVGFVKPDRAIFDHALSLMGNPPPEQVLMVGDNPDTDILGAMNAGIDACWLNAQKQPIPKHIAPQYQVTSLLELEKLFAEVL